MAQGYYTLLEAAQFVGLPPDELKQMAQRNQIRSFQDRGTLRFRLQDVQELARRRGATSDPELVLGEAPAPRSGASPRPEGPRTPPRSPKPAPVSPVPAAPQSMPDVFDFDLGADQVDVGQELFAKVEQPSSKGKKPGSASLPRTPAPGKSGSDSDVKLVAEGSDFSISVGSDSDVKLVTGDSGVKLTPPPGLQPPSSRSSKSPSKLQPPSSGSKSPSKPGPKSPSKLGPITPAPPKSPSKLGPADSSPQKRPSRLETPQPADSGVRLVPADSDSDVRIVGAGSDEVPLGEAPPPDISDSDIRLERIPERAPHESGEEMMLTEEINLDEEIRRQEAAQRKPTPSKLRPKSGLKFPTSSPFELSDSELQRPSSLPGEIKPDSSDFELKAQVKDDSSDFDVQPMAESSDFSIEVPAEEQALAGEPGLSGPSSGISLQNPVDAGISLEQGDDSVDFDLSLAAEATPKPVQKAPSPADSDSEFELSLDDSGQGPLASEDSEFELTLDDSGQLADMEAEASASATEDVGERDIFETDFEVPGLDDSKEAKLDTDLDSSDFDIAARRFRSGVRGGERQPGRRPGRRSGGRGGGDGRGRGHRDRGGGGRRGLRRSGRGRGGAGRRSGGGRGNRSGP
ncbi:MAG: hypothetical protein U0793_04015 [Gemmataceae bacterium]